MLDLIVSNNSICELSDIQFTDISNYNPDSWFWEFGDGNNSFLQNPPSYLSGIRILHCKFTISINGECVNTIEKIDFVEVFDEPNIVFSSNQLYSCNLPFNVDFSMIIL